MHEHGKRASLSTSSSSSFDLSSCSHATSRYPHIQYKHKEAFFSMGQPLITLMHAYHALSHRLATGTRTAHLAVLCSTLRRLLPDNDLHLYEQMFGG